MIENTSNIDDDTKTLLDENGGSSIGDSKTASSAPPVATYIPGHNSLDGSTVYGETDDSVGASTSKDISSLRNPSYNNDTISAQMKQMKYNQNKVMLDRCINSTIQLINDIKTQNNETSLYIPLDELVNNELNAKLLSTSSRRAILKSKSFSDQDPAPTANNNNSTKFELLSLDVKMGPNSNIDTLLNQFDDSTLVTLINDKFQQIIRHLYSLKDRIDDTNSKVLVTGDLNSGKSSFCNALLRRNVLPTDQQPCTNVFCELISDKENKGVEEVHAVYIGLEYNIKDATTFKKFKLTDLSDLVYENDTYSILKIYVKDNRSPESSLLKNGVVDIRLIDAPGLNLDSYQTMQLFSTQEEIDLVVFVVNAENHFTLSGREFIASVNKDKKFSFIVVNKYDNIKRKDKCQEKIMQQVRDLAPETHKDSQDFVHFISSQEVFNSDGDGSDDGGDGGDDGEDHSNDENNHPDFDRLEASLRNFVLEKRSVSKLLPAKNFLSKVFRDLAHLVELNEVHYESSKDKYEVELKLITPKYEDAIRSSVKVNDKITRLIDNYTNDVYDKTRSNILNTIEAFENAKSVDSSVTIFSIDRFIQQTKINIINHILASIDESEDYARSKTSSAICEIRGLGSESLGLETISNSRFKSEIMYSHKKDIQLKNRINVGFEISDMIDFGPISSFCNNIQSLFSLSEWSFDKLLSSSLVKTSMSSMVILWSPKIITLVSGMGTLVKLPSVIHYSALAIFIGYPVYYIVKESPKTIHRNIIRRIRGSLEREDYIHQNSLRVSKEVRKVLNYPAKDVSLGLSALVDREAKLKRDLTSKMEAVKVNIGFLHKLRGRVETQAALLSNFDVD